MRKFAADDKNDKDGKNDKGDKDGKNDKNDKDDKNWGRNIQIIWPLSQSSISDASQKHSKSESIWICCLHRYGGAHKQRFNSDGTGKGKVGSS